MKKYLMILLIPLMVSCSSTQTKLVKKVDYVDAPVLVDKLVYPPNELLILCDPVYNLDYKSTWTDVILQSLDRKYELEKCSKKMETLMNWVEKHKELNSDR